MPVTFTVFAVPIVFVVKAAVPDTVRVSPEIRSSEYVTEADVVPS